MARRGPIPKPTSLHLLLGNSGKRARRGVEPTGLGELSSDPPDFLAADALAAAEYRRVVPRLTSSRIATVLDLPVVCAHCFAWSDYISARQALAEGGRMLRHANGHQYANPYLRVAKVALQQLHSTSIELALTPLSRARIKITPPPRESDLDRFRRKHGDGRVRHPRVDPGNHPDHDHGPDHA